MHVRDLTLYLAELADNNNRAWFVMNKPRYDILREEFLALLTGLIAQISQFDPLVRDCDPKKALFRINRDVRFAKDKRPYKTAFSAAIVPGNLRKPSQGGGPAYYFHIDASGELLYAAGEYMPPADRLKQIRHHIAEHGTSLVNVLKEKKLQRTFGNLPDREKLQRPPKGFDATHPQIELIKHKHFMVCSRTSVHQLKPEMLSNTLVSRFKEAYQFVCWLREAK